MGSSSWKKASGGVDDRGGGCGGLDNRHGGGKSTGSSASSLFTKRRSMLQQRKKAASSTSPQLHPPPASSAATVGEAGKEEPKGNPKKGASRAPAQRPPSAHARRAQKRNKAWSKANEAAARVRHSKFGTPEALAEHCFDPALTYTFDYYDSFFQATPFVLDLGLKRVDLAPMIGEQPLQLDMAKDMDTGEYLWKFEIWHARCLRDDSPLFAANADKAAEQAAPLLTTAPGPT